MSNTWVKIKMWTRMTVFSAAAIYLLLFVIFNRGNPATIHVPFVGTYQENVLLVLLLTAVFSIFGWWLLKTVLRAVRQLKEINRRAQMERLEKENADMAAKAAKLQTRTETAPPHA